MAYTHGKNGNVRFLASGASSPITSTTPAVKATITPGLQPLEVTGIWALITTDHTTPNAVFEVNLRTAPGVTSGEEVIGTITIPYASDAVGQVYYKRITPVKVYPGQELALELVTAAGAGAAIWGLEVNEASETPTSRSNMIESA